MTRLAYVLRTRHRRFGLHQRQPQRSHHRPDRLHLGADGRQLAAAAAPPAAAPARAARRRRRPPAAQPAAHTTATRTVEETDLYRLEGNRLYYLNGYRGLMVFDVTRRRPSEAARPLAHLRLAGRDDRAQRHRHRRRRRLVRPARRRHAVPRLDRARPRRHRSRRTSRCSARPSSAAGCATRASSATCSTRSARTTAGTTAGTSTAGGVDGVDGSTQPTETVIVSSVSFANNVITAVGNVKLPRLQRHLQRDAQLDPARARSRRRAEQRRRPDRAALPRHHRSRRRDRRSAARSPSTGSVQGWGADNGRWNLDFADGKTAHVVGCAGGSTAATAPGYSARHRRLHQPRRAGARSRSSPSRRRAGASPRASTPTACTCRPTPTTTTTAPTPRRSRSTTSPIRRRRSSPARTTIPGTVWNILPAPQHAPLRARQRLRRTPSTGESVSLKYLDVTNPTAPPLLGTRRSAAAGLDAGGRHLQGVHMDATKGLVVLPFSGWSYDSRRPTTTACSSSSSRRRRERTAGAAHTKGWVERGIFVEQPPGVAQRSGARGRRLHEPRRAGGDRRADAGAQRHRRAARRRHHRRDLERLVGQRRDRVRGARAADRQRRGDDRRRRHPDAERRGRQRARLPQRRPRLRRHQRARRRAPARGRARGGGTQLLSARRAGAGGRSLERRRASLRGKVQLPVDPWGYYWAGAGGASGGTTGTTAPRRVQVGNDALAFRRWEPIYDANGRYVDTNSSLYVVDLSNPDAPAMASTLITDDPDGWWGNMRVVGDTLYTTHYEWFYRAGGRLQSAGPCSYYADRIDLSDRAHPRIEAKINVPGLLVGGSDTDPSICSTPSTIAGTATSPRTTSTSCACTATQAELLVEDDARRLGRLDLRARQRARTCPPQIYDPNGYGTARRT